MGLAAAAAAGVPTMITTNDNTAHEDFDRALLVLDTLGEPELPATARHGVLKGPCVTVEILEGLLRPVVPLRAA